MPEHTARQPTNGNIVHDNKGRPCESRARQHRQPEKITYLSTMHHRQPARTSQTLTQTTDKSRAHGNTGNKRESRTRHNKQPMRTWHAATQATSDILVHEYTVSQATSENPVPGSTSNQREPRARQRRPPPSQRPPRGTTRKQQPTQHPRAGRPPPTNTFMAGGNDKQLGAYPACGPGKRDIGTRSPPPRDNRGERPPKHERAAPPVQPTPRPPDRTHARGDRSTTVRAANERGGRDNATVPRTEEHRTRHKERRRRPAPPRSRSRNGGESPAQHAKTPRAPRGGGAQAPALLRRGHKQRHALARRRRRRGQPRAHALCSCHVNAGDERAAWELLVP